jgi:hypothetical protein
MRYLIIGVGIFAVGTDLSVALLVLLESKGWLSSDIAPFFSIAIPLIVPALAIVVPIRMRNRRRSKDSAAAARALLPVSQG